MSMARLHISSAGMLSSIQDAGRPGLRHLGIPWSGVMAPDWQQLGNALVGNTLQHGVIECFEGGLQFTVEDAPIRLAVMGAHDLQMTVSRDRSTWHVKPARSYTLLPDSRVKVQSTGSFRHLVMALQGLQVTQHLGSSSTYAKAALGGIDGRALTAGDMLWLASATPSFDRQCAPARLTSPAVNPLRVVLGPQQQHFSANGLQSFLDGEFVLGNEADRMGARLTGPVIEHRDTAARDIVSDAIVPGSVQVPGNGQPIVLLNDAHTVGGYPKIATVVSTDLPLLSLCRPGSRFRFEALDVDQAIDLVRLHRQTLQQAIDKITALADPEPDTSALLSHNLIDGVTDGQ